MNAEQTVIHAILKYPSLFKDIDFQHSKEKVIDHLFFTNGNGYEWVNGELVLSEYEEDGKFLEFPDNYFDTALWSDEEDEDTLIKEFRLSQKKEYKAREICNKHVISLYPICKYAQILNLPKDIKKDWLLLAEEAVALGCAYYNDPYKHYLQFYIDIWLKERNYTAIKKFVTEQLELLQLAYLKIQKIKDYAI